MKFWIICVSLLVLVLLPQIISAGPYAPAADEEGTTAVYKDDPAFGSWASGVDTYNPGANVDSGWQDTDKALGMATGSIYDIVSLGEGGDITLTFDESIQNRDGWDFAVFENAVTDSFLELAFVEVSSNGTDFVRFDNDSLTQDPVPAFGSLDTTDIHGLAGKYRIGYATPFDLEDLPDKETVDINNVTHIKIVDIKGDGTVLDTSGDVIYDPYETFESAGFDLEAIGILISDPTIPWVYDDTAPTSGGCFIATAAYGSPMEPKVQILRDFRDTYLLRSTLGSGIVKIYYRLSPKAAGFITEREPLRYVVRIALLPFVGISYVLLHISAVQTWMILSLSFILLTSGLIVVLNLARGSIENR